MRGGYVHHIDPILADVAGAHLWWYGLGFAIGFLQIHRHIQREHVRLGLTQRAAWALSIVIVIGVLSLLRYLAVF